MVISAMEGNKAGKGYKESMFLCVCFGSKENDAKLIQLCKV